MPPQYSQAICRKSGRTRIFLQRQYLFFLHFTNRFVHIFVYFDLKSTYFGSVSSIMVQIGPIFWYWNNIRKWNFLPPWVLEKKKTFPRLLRAADQKTGENNTVAWSLLQNPLQSVSHWYTKISENNRNVYGYSLIGWSESTLY